MGKRVATPEGVGRVGELDVLRGRVRVYFDGQPPRSSPPPSCSRRLRPPTPPPTARSES